MDILGRESREIIKQNLGLYLNFNHEILTLPLPQLIFLVILKILGGIH